MLQCDSSDRRNCDASWRRLSVASVGPVTFSPSLAPMPPAQCNNRVRLRSSRSITAHIGGLAVGAILPPIPPGTSQVPSSATNSSTSTEHPCSARLVSSTSTLTPPSPPSNMTSFPSCRLKPFNINPSNARCRSSASV